MIDKIETKLKNYLNELVRTAINFVMPPDNQTARPENRKAIPLTLPMYCGVRNRV